MYAEGCFFFGGITTGVRRLRYLDCSDTQRGGYVADVKHEVPKSCQNAFFKNNTYSAILKNPT